jgi:hypothetical protein
MPLDRSFIERNQASTQRIRDLTARLSDDDLKRRVGEHWTVAVALIHLAFWDRRVLIVLDNTQREGKVVPPDLGIIVNDISLPIWLAVPPREAVRLAIETAEEIDKRLEEYPPDLLEQVGEFNMRYVIRALHRGEHLDEVDQALSA